LVISTTTDCALQFSEVTSYTSSDTVIEPIDIQMSSIDGSNIPSLCNDLNFDTFCRSQSGIDEQLFIWYQESVSSLKIFNTTEGGCEYRSVLYDSSDDPVINQTWTVSSSSSDVFGMTTPSVTESDAESFSSEGIDSILLYSGISVGAFALILLGLVLLWYFRKKRENPFSKNATTPTLRDVDIDHIIMTKVDDDDEQASPKITDTLDEKHGIDPTAEWKKVMSPEFGVPYWYNSLTSKSTWVNPYGDDQNPEWVESFSKEYNTAFWFNKKTGESVWHNPNQ